VTVLERILVRHIITLKFYKQLVVKFIGNTGKLSKKELHKCKMSEYKNIQKMRKTIAMILDKPEVKIDDICSTIFALETPEWDNDYVLSSVKSVGRICQINDPALKEIAFIIIKDKFTLRHSILID